MPKQGRRDLQETRKQQVRRVREERQQRFFYFALGGVALLIVLVIGFGYYRENVAKFDSVIVSVNGTRYTVRDYQKRIRYDSSGLLGQYNSIEQNLATVNADPSLEFLRASLQQQQSQVASAMISLPRTTLETMIDDELVRQQASKKNITLTEDEINQEVEIAFGYERPTATPTEGPSPTATTTKTPTLTPTVTRTPAITLTPTRPLTPTLTPTRPLTLTTPTLTPTTGPTETPLPTSTPLSYQGFSDLKKQAMDALQKNASISEADYRKYVETTLLRRKLQAQLAALVPTTEEQVNARHILVKTYDEALLVENRLKNGEDFAKVAQDVSIDTGTKELGGDLGWFPRGLMIKNFEDTAFSLSINQVSQPITSTFGAHVIQVLGHEQNRPLDARALQTKQSQALNNELQALRLVAIIERYYNEAYVPPEIKRIIAQFLGQQ